MMSDVNIGFLWADHGSKRNCRMLTFNSNPTPNIMERIEDPP